MKESSGAKGILNIEIFGFKLPLFLLIFALVFVAMLLGWLPGGMLGAFLVMMVFGALFNWIGNNTPIVKTYLGGGAIVCIFASAVLVYTGVIPEKVVSNIDSFMNTTGFLNFYIAALITGSILGMSRSLLLRASVRFLPVALCAMTLGCLLVGLVGAIMGYGFTDAIMYIAIPMMGGGMGAGVVPLSGMYAEALHLESAGEIMSRMIPASTLGNVTAIVLAGVLARVGQKFPSINGEGKLMRKNQEDMSEGEAPAQDVKLMGMGLITAMTFYLLGTYVNKAVPAVHTYAWMIILVAIAKATGIVPKQLEYAAQQWSQFVMTNWTQALLVGIGASMIDLGAVISSFSVTYLILVLVVVCGVALGAGLGGQLVGFYPIESSITAGLCTTNMGGTGDIAVLSAADRMELLPFAQISTRICGALVLVVASILTKLLF
ncbi:MAG: 2-hydroxycarboxylate transporter family protein [Firmicutes bacterium]|nr:2-hydroxycarboxylate transporter family protein [Bacillota bacterium]